MSNENLHPIFLRIVEDLIKSAQPAPPPPANEHPLFGPVIHSYTRAQAIEDGVLVNLGMFVSDEGVPVLELVGIRFPVAMTGTAYGLVIGEYDGELLATAVVTKRVIYLLATLKRAIMLHRGVDLTRIDFSCTSADLKPVQLKALCGPGDSAEPVITVMLPEED